MDIKEFLSPNDKLIDVRASDETRFLRELARRAAASLNLARNALLPRFSNARSWDQPGQAAVWRFPTPAFKN